MHGDLADQGFGFKAFSQTPNKNWEVLMGKTLHDPNHTIPSHFLGRVSEHRGHAARTLFCPSRGSSEEKLKKGSTMFYHL